MRFVRMAMMVSCLLAGPAAGAQGQAGAGVETLQGALTAADEVLPSGEYAVFIERTFEAAVPVLLTLHSTDFDAYLVVLDPAGDAVLEVDDSVGFGLDVREILVPAVTGTYTLVVTSAFPGELGAYELSIASGAAEAAATAERALDPSTGIVGAIPIGGRVVGRLAGSDRATYHTYIVPVPPGTARVSFVMHADADLDVFIKHGSDIVEWGDDGDWDQRDIDVAPFATLTVSGPRPGPWYVDVVFLHGGSTVANYTLEVR